MIFEFWWLLIVPILFGFGWLSSWFIARDTLRQAKELPDSYFKGLNFLLNEDHDKAINAFIEVTKLDAETTELHFALGSLFRRKGEIERAIRVHQSLLNRDDISQAQIEHAMFEIGIDFLKAGLLDRAESSFKELLDTKYGQQSLESLMRIYEITHDWQKVIETANQLILKTGKPIAQLAHYYCELVEQKFRQFSRPNALAPSVQDIAQIEEWLTQARLVYEQNAEQTAGQSAKRKYDGIFVRINSLSSKMAALQGNNQLERLYLEQILHTAPAYSSLIAKDLLQSYKDDPHQGLQLLRAQYKHHPSLDLFNQVFLTIRQQDGEAQAWSYAKQSFINNPSLLGLDRLLEMELKSNKNNDQPQVGQLNNLGMIEGQNIALFHKMIHKHTNRLDCYLCEVCGFRCNSYYWQCPSCNQWDTYLPKRLEDI